MLIGYAYVSTTGQQEISEESIKEKLGVEKVFIDMANGELKGRPRLEKLLDFVREGDTVIVENIGSFARNTQDFLSLTGRLTSKRVGFISKKEFIDTTAETGKHMLAALKELVQLDRDWAMQRRAKGIAAAKAEGKYVGRKPIDISDAVIAEQYRLWKNGEITSKAAAKGLGLSRSTFYRKMAEYEQKHGITPSSDTSGTD